jgi:hypothetical protein
MGCAVEVECSPAVEAKVVSAATRNRSYEEASADLRDLAELEISAKRCARMTQRIGQERLRQREARCEAFDERPLPEQKRGLPNRAPANGWEGRVAAVIVDGGRMQVRDERWGTPKEPGERRNWWREPKIGCVTTFQSRACAEDPLPEIPACLLDPLFVIPRVLEMKRTRSGAGSEEKTPFPSGAAGSAVPVSKPERWSPPPLVRSVVGTLGSYGDLGRLVEVEAWHRGFAVAPRKVFLGDGLAANWCMHRERFSQYTPVVDLMHAIAYVGGYRGQFGHERLLAMLLPVDACGLAWGGKPCATRVGGPDRGGEKPGSPRSVAPMPHVSEQQCAADAVRRIPSPRLADYHRFG